MVALVKDKKIYHLMTNRKLFLWLYFHHLSPPRPPFDKISAMNECRPQTIYGNKQYFSIQSSILSEG